jgi:thiosulfate/3-mercaptopyruvate sulfurtransferase
MSIPVRERGYARPELLAETDWLADFINDPKTRVIDARQHQDYLVGHIPGAINITGFGGIPRSENRDMAEPEKFGRMVSELGIANDMTVVVYDAPSQMMGTVAWAFMYYGHSDVKILDGGFAKWVNEGRPTSSEVPLYPAESFIPTTVENIYCSLDHAKRAINQPKTIFWDTRSLPEYQGVAQVGPSASNTPQGRIAGAINLEWSELFEDETKLLKTAGEISSILNSKGLTPECEINTY